MPKTVTDNLPNDHPNNTSYSESEKIAFIQSCWHRDIVDRCREGFTEKLTELDDSIVVEYHTVPGAFEIPLVCKQLLSSGEYALVVAAGFVVDGGIYRHEFVAQSVISGLMQVQLEMNKPVLSAVLTPKDFQETEAHQQFFFDHMQIKGKEAAEVAASLLKSKSASHELRATSCKPEDKLSRVS